MRTRGRCPYAPSTPYTTEGDELIPTPSCSTTEGDNRTTTRQHPIEPPRVTWHVDAPPPTTVPTPTLSARAAFANPSTVDRATQLAARIASPEAKLLQARLRQPNI
jgi:hypothetical protein